MIYNASTCSSTFLTGKKGQKTSELKEAISRVNSEISLNSGDVSFGSDTENAVVCREDSQTLTGLGMQANGNKALTIHSKQRQTARAQLLRDSKLQNNEETAKAKTGHCLRSSTVSAETSNTRHTTYSCFIRTGPV